MKNITGNINILIGKVVSGNASPEEVREVEKWIKASDDNRKVFSKSKKAWEKSAAWISDEVVEQDKKRVQLEINKRLSRQIQRINQKSLIYKIAAIIAFPLAFAISWYIFQDAKIINQQQPELCLVTAPKGHISKCVLPDGTEVWINTGSTLTYNTSEFNKKLREVGLEGEAFFQVSKNKEKLFKVKTPYADVKVTGTSFNVKAFTGSDSFETVLEEGSIDLEFKNSRQVVHIKPGERAVYELSKSKVFLETVDAGMFTCWRNGEIIFKDASLSDLIKELERIYDIRFHLKDQSLGSYRFRGMFSYNNNLIDALEKIKRTAQIDYYIENKEVWLSRIRK